MGDFTTVGILGTMPMVAIVPQESPYGSFKEVIDAALEAPGELSFAQPAVASLPLIESGHVNSVANTQRSRCA